MDLGGPPRGYVKLNASCHSGTLLHGIVWNVAALLVSPFYNLPPFIALCLMPIKAGEFQIIHLHLPTLSALTPVNTYCLLLFTAHTNMKIEVRGSIGLRTRAFLGRDKETVLKEQVSMRWVESQQQFCGKQQRTARGLSAELEV